MPRAAACGTWPSLTEKTNRFALANKLPRTSMRRWDPVYVWNNDRFPHCSSRPKRSPVYFFFPSPRVALSSEPTYLALAWWGSFA